MAHSKLNPRYLLNFVLTRIVLPFLPLSLLGIIIGSIILAYLKFGSSFFFDVFSTDESRYKFILDFVFKAFLLVAVLQIYILAFGLSIDKFWARRFARRHVIVIAGREGLVRRSGIVDSHISSILNIRNAFQEKQKVAESGLGDSFSTAVEFARSISLSEKEFKRPNEALINILQAVFSTKVIFCAPAISQKDRERLWNAGVCVVENDYEIDELFDAVGGGRAKIVYFMRDSTLENLSFSQSFLQRSKQLQVRCLVEPYEMRFSLSPEDIFEQKEIYRLRFFNESELIARTLLSTYGPDGNRPEAARVHVLVIGMGSVGTALTLQLARIGQFRNRSPVQITLISQSAEETLEELRASNNCFNKLNEHCPNATAINSDFFGSSDDSLEKILEKRSLNWANLNSIYICTKDELVNLRVAKLLEKLQKPLDEAGKPLLDKNVPIIVLDPPGGTLLNAGGSGDAGGGSIRIFSLTKRMNSERPSRTEGSWRGDVNARTVTNNFFYWSADRLDSFFDDEDARSYHSAYVQAEKLKGNSEADWEDLDESYRESNRYRSEFFPIFARALGLQEVVETDGRPAVTWDLLSDDEQTLAKELEHNFWWQGKMLSNWERTAWPEDAELSIRNAKKRRLKAARRHWLLIPFGTILRKGAEIKEAIKEAEVALRTEDRLAKDALREMKVKVEEIEEEIKKDEDQVKAMFSKVIQRGNKLVRIAK